MLPDAVVIVATVRALKMHGGLAKTELAEENLEALEKGIPNLLRHVSNIRDVFKLPCVVADEPFPDRYRRRNRSHHPSLQESGRERGSVQRSGPKGGAGGVELAKEVVRLCENEQRKGEFHLLL